ncbi:M23 family metallopeptidase [Corynebacterium sp. p3-SID1145]|uniref:M23 family metallopeptidase n=1 Tax=unclassified Corynebacterium TaxID=2624378 RepID=UPI0021AAB48B|nr:MULTISPECIES: M23 family metallopeptidase [unclassified Corynebacterium]MCT1451398.1 M23 family metallopeptidase [Corynebacterium sp. p3-SID1145]MCT1460594.1 M23 family metallopeptidase [Corynebacterium sp. p3-SID1140]
MNTSRLRAAPLPRSAFLLLSIFLPLAAFAAGAGAGPAAAYVDPTTGSPTAAHVTRSADIPEHNWLAGHRGVDLAARTGQDILAAKDGVVAFTGVVAGVPVLSVDHADGIRTTYQPVHATVKVGDEVEEGEVIGRLAPSSGGHDGLHWGARTGPDAYINPLTLLDAPQIRLKPVDAHGRTRS